MHALACLCSLVVPVFVTRLSLLAHAFFFDALLSLILSQLTSLEILCACVSENAPVSVALSFPLVSLSSSLCLSVSVCQNNLSLPSLCLSRLIVL